MMTVKRANSGMSCCPGEESGFILFPKGKTCAALGKESQIQKESSPAKKSSCSGVPAHSAVWRHTVMATFEEQTACIVEALFSDLLGEDESDCQNLETDWGGKACCGRKKWFLCCRWQRSALAEHLKEGCSLELFGFLKCRLVMTSKLSLFWAKNKSKVKLFECQQPRAAVCLEPVQSAGEAPATSDPAVVTSRLRQMGDQCNMDFERASSEALAEGKEAQTASRCLQMEKFGAAVDSLSSSWSDQNPALVYERAFLCVSVKLLLHVAKKVPAMVHPNRLTKVINGNSQVRNYIEACGGWENLDN
ncbi:bcl-2-like protein 15 [Cariama cristata]